MRFWAGNLLIVAITTQSLLPLHVGSGRNRISTLRAFTIPRALYYHDHGEPMGISTKIILRYIGYIYISDNVPETVPEQMEHMGLQSYSKSDPEWGCRAILTLEGQYGSIAYIRMWWIRPNRVYMSPWRCLYRFLNTYSTGLDISQ
jgi:hypothetical protein